jgi:tripartite-type tricarboxylate transporter receptor subunit TctC
MNISRFAVVALCALAPALAAAQGAYPTKPIRLLVGFPPGGSTDVLARALAVEARKTLGQEILVVNKPGATGSLAVLDVLSGGPDGYSLGITPSSTMTLAHHFNDIPPDLLERTEGLLLAARQRIGIAVKSDSPIASMNDFLKRAKEAPGKMSVGIPGAGTMTEIISRAVFKAAGVEVTLVPYAGDAPVSAAVLGGHVMAGSYSAGGWNTHVVGRTMRLLASMEQERADAAPDVPTLIELGYPLKGDAIQHLFAPKGLAPAVRHRLMESLGQAIRSKVYVDIAVKNALYEPKVLTGGELDAYLVKDRVRNAGLVASLGLKKQ